MIGISKLYLGTIEPSDALRYGRRSSELPSHLLQFSQDKKPVVVWNMTNACNLKCVHCYASADTTSHPEETLSTGEAKTMIDDLAAFGAPVLLFSGGEPLTRRDLPELAEYAASKGMRTVISTNGTLIDDQIAARLKTAGLSYVGISLDGMRETNDRFRGQSGAFDAALAGMRACKKAGIKVGLRYTITRHNFQEISPIFDLLETENIPRVCFYHLVYTGRGADIMKDDLSATETRKAVDLIIDLTAAMHSRGIATEVLTVDNHCDGPYLYMRMLREKNPNAENVLQLLKMNGGNSSGNGIGCISWDGTVYPDQFWRNHPLGNIREKPFSRIWADLSSPFLASLKDKYKHAPARCRKCRFLDICGGNFRARGEAATGNPWGFDPACYLTDEEITNPAGA